MENIIEKNAAEFPAEIAFNWISDDGTHIVESITYSELFLSSKRLSSTISKLGVCGEPVILMFPPNGLWFVRAFYACIFAHVIAVPVYPPETSRADRTIPRLEAIVKDSGARVILTIADIASMIELIRSDLPESLSKMAVYSVDEDIANRVQLIKECQATAVFLQYTSGSTGSPKGVVVTEKSLIANCRKISRHLRITRATPITAWLPLYHDMGLVGFVCQGTISGACVSLMSPIAFMKDPASWIKALSLTRAEITAAPNFAYELCTKKIDIGGITGIDLSHMRAALNGAEPVRDATITAFTKKFSKFGLNLNAVMPVYGLAESTLFVCGIKEQTQYTLSTTFVSCGISDMDEVIIVSPNDRHRLKDGSVGEIWVSGDSVAAGYWNRGKDDGTFSARLDDGSTKNYLRTGDLGFIVDGEIYISGRIKDLIIFRGKNYYPQDIEAAAERVEHIRPGCTTAFSRRMTPDDEEEIIVVAELRSGYSGDHKNVAIAMMREISEICGISPNRIILIKQGTSYKTSSGKIQRNATLIALNSKELDVIYEFIKGTIVDGDATGYIGLTENERIVADAWIGVIPGMTQNTITGPSMNFFELGGDSLHAAAIAACLKVRPREIMEHPILSDAAVSLLTKDTKNLEVIPITSIDRKIFVVSGEQEQLLVSAKISGFSAYVGRLCMIIRQNVSVDQFSRIVERLCVRHELLRTTYSQLKNGKFIQTVHGDDEKWIWARTAFSECEHESNAKSMAADLCTTAELDPFCGKAPVMFSLVKIRDIDACAICMAAHHVCHDGMSLRIVAKEFGNELTPRSRVESVRVQYGDYSEWQRKWIAESPEAKKQLEFWCNELTHGSPPSALEIPLDRTITTSTAGHASVYKISIPESLASRIRNFKYKNPDGTMTNARFPLLLSAYAITLSRLCSAEEIAIGVPHHGRFLPELQTVIGYFVKMMTIRVVCNDELTAEDMIRSVAATVTACSHNSDVPLMDVMRMATSSCATFKTIFSYQSFESEMKMLGDSVVDSVEEMITRDDIPKFMIYAIVSETLMSGGGMTAEFSYDSWALERETVESVAIVFCRILNNLAEALSGNPHMHVKDIRMTHPDYDSTEGLLLCGAESARATELHELAHAAFERWAKTRSDAIALEVIAKSNVVTLTYGQLDKLASDVSHVLEKGGVLPGDVVAIDTDGGIPDIAFTLAVLKCGAAFMPIQRTDPHERIAHLMTLAGCKWIISDDIVSAANFSKTVSSFARVVSIDVDHTVTWMGTKLSMKSRCSSEDLRLACVLCTSGSTGTPKAVCLTHNSISTFVNTYTRVNGWDGSCKSLIASPRIFDAWLMDVFCALFVGGTIVISDFHLTDIDTIFAVIKLHGITHTFFTTCIAARFFAKYNVPDTMRHISFGGEEAPRNMGCNVIRSCRGTKCTVFNGYGPTECIVFSTRKLITAADAADVDTQRRPSIGERMPCHSARVVDSKLRMLPIGFPGEMLIGGPCCAGWYAGDPVATSEKFISIAGEKVYRTGDIVRRLPHNRGFEFLGRRDSQVKVRGRRIDLSEIEMIVSSTPGISSAVVIVRNGDIICFVLRSNTINIDSAIENAIERCKTQLPAYSVPSKIGWLDAFPMTRTGKIDRSAFPDTVVKTPEHQPIQEKDDIESDQTKAIISTVSKVLSCQAKPTDKFFDIGGNSLNAFDLVLSLEQSGYSISHRDVFACATLEDLANKAKKMSSPSSINTSASSTDTLPLLPAQRRYFRMDDSGELKFCHALELELSGEPVECRAIKMAIEYIARVHPALRTRYTKKSMIWTQYISDKASPIVISTNSRDGIDIAVGSIDIIDGPICGAVVSTLPDGSGSKIVLIVHHLAVDNVSWRIILSDFVAILCGRKQIEERASYESCILHFSKQPTNLLSAVDFNMPTFNESLYAEFTRKLPIDVTDVPDTKIHDAMVSVALEISKTLWPSEQPKVDTEFHGRDIDDIDLSTTVGWFTDVKEFPVSEINKSPRISVTFHGVIGGNDAMSEGPYKLKAVRQVATNKLVDPHLRRDHIVDIIAWIDAGQMCFGIWYARGLSLAIDDIGTTIIDRVIKSQIRREIPVTSNQESILVAMDIDSRGQSAYAVETCIELKVPASNSESIAESFAYACRAVVKRHDALRTTFRKTNTADVFEQVIFGHNSTEAKSIVGLIKNVDGDVSDVALSACCPDVGWNVFSDKNPLTKFVVAQKYDTIAVALYTNHALIDATSLDIILREMTIIASKHIDGDVVTLAPPPSAELILKVDEKRIKWARFSESAKISTEFWNEMVGDMDIDILGSKPSHRNKISASVERIVQSSVVSKFEKICAKCGCTKFVALLRIFAEVITAGRGIRTDDLNNTFYIGTAFRGRCQPEDRDAVGYLVDILAVRHPPVCENSVSNIKVAQAMRNTADTLASCITHSQVPPKCRPPLRYGSFFSYYQDDIGDTLKTIHGFPCRITRANDGVDSSTKFDLSMTIHNHSSALKLTLEYDTGMFPSDLAEALISAYQTAIEWISNCDPQTEISNMKLAVDVPETRDVWSTEILRELHEEFDDIAAKNPTAIAAEMDDASWTYSDISIIADSVREIIELYVSMQGDIQNYSAMVGCETIAICTSHHPIYLGCMIGILRSGRAFMPILPGLPNNRVANMIDICSVRLAVCDSRSESWVRGIFPKNVIVVKIDDKPPMSKKSCTRSLIVDKTILRRRAAYVIATSGSTGIPKLIAISHGSISTLIKEWKRLCFGSSKRIMLTASIAFDPSIEDAFCALSSGATLIFPSCNLGDAAGILETMRIKNVEHTFMIFTMLTACCAVGMIPPRMRTIDCGGETLSRDILKTIEGSLGDVTVTDSYGPTETTVTAVGGIARYGKYANTIRLCDTQNTSIGKPLNTHSTYIVFGLRRVPVGFPGELLIGGPCVGNGYVGRESDTKTKFVEFCGDRVYHTGDFVRQLPDGTLEFLGRMDSQVKLRGQRFELGEVNAAAMACRGVIDAKSVITNNKSQLVCYVMPNTIDAATVRTEMTKKLPTNMIPSRIVPISTWPKTPSGKIDLLELKRTASLLMSSIHGSSKELSSVEKMIADVWAPLLKCEISRDANFFELGGDSMTASVAAVRLRSIVPKSNKIALRAADIMRYPILCDFANAIFQDHEPILSRSISPNTPTPSVVSGEQEQMLLLTTMDSNGAEGYSTRSVFSLSGILDIDTLRETISEVTRIHEILRTRYTLTENGFVQTVMQPEWSGALRLTILSTCKDPRSAISRACKEIKFDPLDGTPLSAVFYSWTPDLTESAIGFAASHVCYDGISLDILCNEISTIYAAKLAMPSYIASPPVVQYADYAQWQREHVKTDEIVRRQLDFWTNKLMSTTATIIPSFTASNKTSQTTIDISASDAKSLQTIFRSVATTTFSSMLTIYAWALTCAFTSDNDSIVIGITLDGRNVDGIERTIGYFVKTLPVVMPQSMWRDGSLLPAVRYTMKSVADCHENSDISIIDIVNERRREKHMGAPFSVMFTMDSASESFSLGNSKCEWFDVSSDITDSMFVTSLSVRTEKDGTMRCIFQHDANIIPFTVADIFKTIVTEMITKGTMDISIIRDSSAISSRQEKLETYNQRSHPDIVIDDIYTKLAEIWQETLNIETIEPSTNFFESGGNSLIAAIVASEISRKIHGVGWMSASNLMAYPQFSSMVDEVKSEISNRRKKDLPLIVCVPNAMPIRFDSLRRALTSGCDVDVIDVHRTDISIADIAREISERIILRSKGMSSPVYVIGYCGGAAIAEAVCQMSNIKTMILLGPEWDAHDLNLTSEFLSFFRYCVMGSGNPRISINKFLDIIGMHRTPDDSMIRILTDPTVSEISQFSAVVTTTGIDRCLDATATAIGWIGKRAEYIKTMFSKFCSASKLLERGPGPCTVPSTTDTIIINSWNTKSTFTVNGISREFVVKCSHWELVEDAAVLYLIKNFVIKP